MKKDVTEIQESYRVRYILKGIIISYLLTFLFIFVYSFILTYTNISDSTIPSMVTFISILSIFISTTIYCRLIGNNGIINGGIISLIYILLIYIISSFTKVGFSLDRYSILMIISCVIVGIMGGIIGVNFNKTKRS